MKITLIPILLVCAQLHANPIISDIFESSDSKYWYNLKSDNTYDMQYTESLNIEVVSITGVYKQSGDTCEGNLLLFSDNAQCCLDQDEIYDNWVTTKLWFKGNGTLSLICKNHSAKRVCRDSIYFNNQGECDEILMQRGYPKQSQHSE